MIDNQLLKRAANLARAECANYHNKECIWDECRCHLINSKWESIAEGALDCDWFMQAVLPLDKELNKEIWQQLIGQDGPPSHSYKLCERCRNSYLPTSHRQRFCPVCGEAEKRERVKAKQRRYNERKRQK